MAEEQVVSLELDIRRIPNLQDNFYEGGLASLFAAAIAIDNILFQHNFLKRPVVLAFAEYSYFLQFTAPKISKAFLLACTRLWHARREEHSEPVFRKFCSELKIPFQALIQPDLFVTNVIIRFRGVRNNQGLALEFYANQHSDAMNEVYRATLDFSKRLVDPFLAFISYLLTVKSGEKLSTSRTGHIVYSVFEDCSDARTSLDKFLEIAKCEIPIPIPSTISYCDKETLVQQMVVFKFTEFSVICNTYINGCSDGVQCLKYILCLIDCVGNEHTREHPNTLFLQQKVENYRDLIALRPTLWKAFLIVAYLWCHGIRKFEDMYTNILNGLSVAQKVVTARPQETVEYASLFKSYTHETQLSTFITRFNPLFIVRQFIGVEFNSLFGNVHDHSITDFFSVLQNDRIICLLRTIAFRAAKRSFPLLPYYSNGPFDCFFPLVEKVLHHTETTAAFKKFYDERIWAASLQHHWLSQPAVTSISPNTKFFNLLRAAEIEKDNKEPRPILYKPQAATASAKTRNWSVKLHRGELEKKRPRSPIVVDVDELGDESAVADELEADVSELEESEDSVDIYYAEDMKAYKKERMIPVSRRVSRDNLQVIRAWGVKPPRTNEIVLEDRDLMYRMLDWNTLRAQNFPVEAQRMLVDQQHIMIRQREKIKKLTDELAEAVATNEILRNRQISKKRAEKMKTMGVAFAKHSESFMLILTRVKSLYKETLHYWEQSKQYYLFGSIYTDYWYELRNTSPYDLLPFHSKNIYFLQQRIYKVPIVTFAYEKYLEKLRTEYEALITTNFENDELNTEHGRAEFIMRVRAQIPTPIYDNMLLTRTEVDRRRAAFRCTLEDWVNSHVRSYIKNYNDMLFELHAIARLMEHEFMYLLMHPSDSRSPFVENTKTFDYEEWRLYISNDSLQHANLAFWSRNGGPWAGADNILTRSDDMILMTSEFSNNNVSYGRPVLRMTTRPQVESRLFGPLDPCFSEDLFLDSSVIDNTFGGWRKRQQRNFRFLLFKQALLNAAPGSNIDLRVQSDNARRMIEERMSRLDSGDTFMFTIILRRHGRGGGSKNIKVDDPVVLRFNAYAIENKKWPVALEKEKETVLAHYNPKRTSYSFELHADEDAVDDFSSLF